MFLSLFWLVLYCNYFCDSINWIFGGWVSVVFGGEVRWRLTLGKDDSYLA